MTEEFMCCNFDNCMSPITKSGWLTRCSHVFCKEHGDKFGARSSSKVKCPSCNEVISRQNDVVKFNANPSDLIVSCLRPEKALEYALRATKLWCYQMKVKKKIQIQNVTDKYDKMAYDATVHLQSENKDLKKFIHQIEKELERVNDELLITKQKLHKYKIASEAFTRDKYKLHHKRDQRDASFNFLPNTKSIDSPVFSQPDANTSFFYHL